MKVFTAVVLVLSVTLSVEAQDTIEGRTFVPTITSDYRLPHITVIYSFRLDTSEHGEMKSALQRLLLKFMEVNTSELIAGILQEYLVSRVARISYEEFIVMVAGDPDDNALVDELLVFLSTSEYLDKVEIISMSVTVDGIDDNRQMPVSAPTGNRRCRFLERDEERR